MKHSIGIDFGTTKTMVSYFNPATGRVELIRLGRDRDSIPTTVHVDASGNWTFGEDADDFIEEDPEGYCRAFKLALGETDPVLVRETENGEVSATAEELATRFLAHVKKTCEETALHGEIGKATITIPVSFSLARKESLRRAAHSAGFAEVAFLAEPEAAGIAFLRDNPADAFSRALVLDWGGGTLDISIIARDDAGRIKADARCFEGDDTMGGEEIDHLLWDSLKGRFLSEVGQDIDLPPERQPQRVRRLRQCKEQLSRKDAIPFRPIPPKGLTVTQDELNGIAGPLVQTAGNMLDAVLGKYGASTGENSPDALILIGGTSLMPYIKTALQSRFPNLRVLSWHRSHEAVALGATPMEERSDNAAEMQIAESTEMANPVSGESSSGTELAVMAPVPDGIPEEFKPAWQTLAAELASLGTPTSNKLQTYYGFGDEDEALNFERGVLVRRKRNQMERFSVVDFADESGIPIDILTCPEMNGIGLNDFVKHMYGVSQTFEAVLSSFGGGFGKQALEDNPFLGKEGEAFKTLAQFGVEVGRKIADFHWFQSYSEESYAAKRREISAELSQVDAERKNAEAQLQQSKNSQKGGFFASIKASWVESGLESQIEEAKKKIEEKMAQLRELDEENQRYVSWPFFEKTAELLEMEEHHHELYLEYCRIRHFRNRWGKEVLSEKAVRDGLNVEIESIRTSAQNMAQEIAEMEKRLPVLKEQLSESKSAIDRKQKECASMTEELENRMRSLQEAFSKK